MLNIEVARKALADVYDESNHRQTAPLERLEAFINEVERLITYNAIKQTPALFKVPK